MAVCLHSCEGAPLDPLGWITKDRRVGCEGIDKVSQRGTIIATAIVAVAVIALAVGALVMRPDPNRPYEVTDFGPMTARDLSSQSFLVVPDMLSKIYLAFAETDEALIYDQLALVAADEALETLYLERVGAMVGGGLDKADQELHEMELASLSSRRTATRSTSLSNGALWAPWVTQPTCMCVAIPMPLICSLSL